MRLILQLISRNDPTRAAGESRVLERHGITIGRGRDNDWVLPDPNKILSKLHCMIDFVDGRYLLTDMSTNGTFVNAPDSRVPKGSSIPLNEGDRIFLGDYELVVSVAGSDAPAAVGGFDVDDPSRSIADGSWSSGVGPGWGGAPPSNWAPTPPPVDYGRGPSAQPHGQGADPWAPPSFAATQFASMPVSEPIPENDPIFGRPQQEPWRPEPESDHLPTQNEAFEAPTMRRDPTLEQGLDAIPENWHEALMGRAGPAPATAPPPVAQPPTPEPAWPAPAPPPGGPGGFELPEDWADLAPHAAPQPVPAPVEPLQPPPVPEIPPQPAPEVTLREAPTIAPLPQPGPPVARGPAPRHPPEQVAPQPQPQHQPVSHPQAAMGPIPDAGAEAIAALFQGLGLNPAQANVADPVVFMRQVGEILRAMVAGLQENLSARSSLKGEFRIEKTMIRPKDNNPLKFGGSMDEALAAVLAPANPAFSSGVKAVEEGFGDIRAHQLAVMAGMQTALTALLKRFNPRELEKRLGKHSMFDQIVPGARKARYWEAYEDLYREIQREAEDDFQSLFGREFADAYQAQIKKL